MAIVLLALGMMVVGALLVVLALWKAEKDDRRNAQPGHLRPQPCQPLDELSPRRRTSPIALRGDGVHIAENEMEPGRVYSIKYGKKTLAIVKTADGKIRVCALLEH